MFIIYSLCILLVIDAVICIFKAYRRKFSRIDLLFYILIALSCLVVRMCKPNEEYVKRKIEYYNNLKNMVEFVESLQTRSIRIIFEDDVKKDVKRMNKQILRNRNNYNSFCVGYLYSEEIGKLEELKWQ